MKGVITHGRGDIGIQVLVTNSFGVFDGESTRELKTI
jgi:hypothetical protein